MWSGSIHRDASGFDRHREQRAAWSGGRDDRRSGDANGHPSIENPSWTDATAAEPPLPEEQIEATSLPAAGQELSPSARRSIFRPFWNRCSDRFAKTNDGIMALPATHAGIRAICGKSPFRCSKPRDCQPSAGRARPAAFQPLGTMRAPSNRCLRIDRKPPESTRVVLERLAEVSCIDTV